MDVSGRRAESNGENNSATGIEKFCQPCEFENVITRANGICLKCEEYMCNSCFRNHLKLKLCRHHILHDMNKVSLPSEESEENLEKCKMHDNEAVRFYCRAHEIVGCGDCIILEHSTCKPEYIKDVSKDLQENEEFKGLIKKLDQLQSKNQANHKKCQAYRKDCKDMYEDALKEIRKFKERINKYLDKAEADMITEIEQLQLDNDTLLDKLHQDCDRLSSNLETLKQKMNTDIHRENVLFIYAVNCKHIVKKIEKEVAEVLSVNKVKTFKLVPDEQFVKIITSAKQFCHLNISESKSSADEGSAMSVKEEDKPIVSKLVSHAKVYVGARVRSAEGKIRLSKGQPGTVTALHSDGVVDVRWDATGRTYVYYTIGPGGDLELI